ncbi:MAG: sensor histidine kinase [Gemmatimonadaceae bacterium]
MPDPSRALTRAPCIIAAACIVPAVLDSLQTYMQQRLAGRPNTSWGGIVFSGGEWLFLGALTPIAWQLARRFPLQRETIGRTLAVHLVGALVLCVGWASAGVAARAALGMSFGGMTRLQEWESWTLTTIPWSVFMYFAVLGCVYAFTYFVEAREGEAQAARLSAQLSDARLGALRMQLNPHFLFNSLNAIGVLVRDKNNAAASRMIELLGDVLRTVLRADDRHEIPLGEELEFLDQYLAIEQVRFSDRLRVTWTIGDVRSALVPSFILQPLVENALRHGIAKRAGAGALEIAARRESDTMVLSVSDDGPGLSPASHHATGVGLKNVRERLRTLYRDSARLDVVSRTAGGVTATIRLPYHEARRG